jgi:hypothetical protein
MPGQGCGDDQPIDYLAAPAHQQSGVVIPLVAQWRSWPVRVSIGSAHTDASRALRYEIKSHQATIVPLTETTETQ